MAFSRIQNNNFGEREDIMPEWPNTDLDEVTKIKSIASSGNDGPLLMLNLNRYLPEAGYPDGDLYNEFITIVRKVGGEVGGKILWRTSVHGHVVGDQEIHEALGIWYPTHQAFLNVQCRLTPWIMLITMWPASARPGSPGKRYCNVSLGRTEG